MENEINNIPEHGLYTFEQVKENKEEFAKMFSEGNKELEKCLLKLWNNNIPTLACCGDESTFFGASKINGAFVFLEKPAYISIETTNMKKGNTFQKMARQICKDKNLQFDADYKFTGRKILTLYQEDFSTTKFFKKVNEMLDVFLVIENSIDKNKINLQNYDCKNTITDRIVTSDKASKRFELNHDGHKYEVLNFDFVNTRHSFVLFDAEVQPKKLVGYATYDFNPKTKSFALQCLAISENLRGNKLGRTFLKSFDKMINECHGIKAKNMFVHPCAEGNYQASLEDFYQQCGFKLTNGDPAVYIFNPDAYTGYKSEFNNAIENIEQDIGKNKENIINKDLTLNKAISNVNR